MKAFLLLVTALLLPAGAALAQTVLPSGAVAPSGAGITPGTVPGSQPVTTPDMRKDGSDPRAARHDEKAPGMTHHDERRLRKMAREKPGADEPK